MRKYLPSLILLFLCVQPLLCIQSSVVKTSHESKTKGNVMTGTEALKGTFQPEHLAFDSRRLLKAAGSPAANKNY